MCVCYCIAEKSISQWTVDFCLNSLYQYLRSYVSPNIMAKIGRNVYVAPHCDMLHAIVSISEKVVNSLNKTFRTCLAFHKGMLGRLEKKEGKRRRKNGDLDLL